MHALLNKASSILVFALLLALVATAGVALVATAYGAPPVGSTDPGLSLCATPSSVRSDQSTTVSAHLGVPGAALQVSRRFAGESEFTWLRTLTTDADGTASWEPRSRRTVTYRVEFAGDATYAAAGAETTVSVRPRVGLTTSSAGTVFTGDRVSVSVTVSPARPEGTIELEQWDDATGEWRVLQSLALGGDSRAQWVWRPENAGRHTPCARESSPRASDCKTRHSRAAPSHFSNSTVPPG